MAAPPRAARHSKALSTWIRWASLPAWMPVAVSIAVVQDSFRIRSWRLQRGLRKEIPDYGVALPSLPDDLAKTLFREIRSQLRPLTTFPRHRASSKIPAPAQNRRAPNIMKLLTLSGMELERALPMREAVETMKDAFACLSGGHVANPTRMVLGLPRENAQALCMPAYMGPQGSLPAALGTKLVTVFPQNPRRRKPSIHGLMVLFHPQSGEPVALIDGEALTAWRTGAASGAATDLLANTDAKIGALFGTAAQAETQALAVDCVRVLQEIRVYSRDPDHRAAFIKKMQVKLQAKLVEAHSPEYAVEGADVICTATNSTAPIFPGELVKPGAHLNAVGSYRHEMRELDTATVSKARVFVDAREAAQAEAGDLEHARQEGVTQPENWIEVGEVVTDPQKGRHKAQEITLFKSVGVAVQDIAAASLAMVRGRQLGLGKTIEI